MTLGFQACLTGGMWCINRGRKQMGWHTASRKEAEFLVTHVESVLVWRDLAGMGNVEENEACRFRCEKWDIRGISKPKADWIGFCYFDLLNIAKKGNFTTPPIVFLGIFQNSSGIFYPLSNKRYRVVLIQYFWRVGNDASCSFSPALPARG